MTTIENLEKDQVIVIDGKEHSVKFSATLHSLVQMDGQGAWVRSGKSYRAIYAGGVWFMSLPLKEGGKTRWFRMELKEAGSGLGGFFLGSKEDPGPGRKFAKTQERGEVRFDLFKESWLMTDIGTFDVEADGFSEIMKNGDRLYYLVSTQGEERIFLYLDARPKEAQGIGAAFVGVAFNPETEIESIL